MNKLLTFEEYKTECLKNPITQECYKNDSNYEERMKRAYDAYVFRFNALKKSKEYEKNIREKYNKIKRK